MMMASDASAVALGEGQFKLVYCSLLGKMAIPSSDFSDPDTPDDTPRAPDFDACPLCQAIGATAYASAAVGYGLEPVQLTTDRLFIDLGRAGASHRPLRTSARGPPVLHG